MQWLICLYLRLSLLFFFLPSSVFAWPCHTFSHFVFFSPVYLLCMTNIRGEETYSCLFFGLVLYLSDLFPKRELLSILIAYLYLFHQAKHSRLSLAQESDRLSPLRQEMSTCNINLQKALLLLSSPFRQPLNQTHKIEQKPPSLGLFNSQSVSLPIAPTSGPRAESCNRRFFHPQLRRAKS